ncbi:MAG: 4-(cytidine 5'-diphospho)-2-C-methyl-D-erythritol kinase [Candidatus Latescibacteria bacterium]|nr:4-(cytidine 5'-diphospho)-2-C-methyl-D-erythritol kinase [Candidatus Latescibacterota bacterium]
MITEQAYAKINLGLKILGQRPDGYHDILSVMQTVDLYDTLVFTECQNERITIRCETSEIPRGEENLIYQAVLAFQGATSLRRGIDVTLTKRIPVGAGLGGGSADAAATLRGMNRLWNDRFSLDELRKIAASVGSDVLFLLQPGTAIVEGRGERLRYVTWRGGNVYLLVYPQLHISTGWAYRVLDGKIALTKVSKYISLVTSLRSFQGNWETSLIDSLENDFEEPLGQVYPMISMVKDRLIDAGAVAASLSGSGSTVYGIFAEERDAEAARGALDGCGWDLFVCHPVR